MNRADYLALRAKFGGKPKPAPKVDDRPRAAIGSFPYPHRTVAEVWAAERKPVEA